MKLIQMVATPISKSNSLEFGIQWEVSVPPTFTFSDGNPGYSILSYNSPAHLTNSATPISFRMLTLHFKRNISDKVTDISLALNEARAPYSPTLWTKEIDNDQILKQVWFPGIHTSNGGGNAVYSISDITLAWMVQKLKNHTDLQCDQTYLENGIKGRGVQLFGPNDLS